MLKINEFMMNTKGNTHTNGNSRKILRDIGLPRDVFIKNATFNMKNVHAVRQDRDFVVYQFETVSMAVTPWENGLVWVLYTNDGKAEAAGFSLHYKTYATSETFNSFWQDVIHCTNQLDVHVPFKAWNRSVNDDKQYLVDDESEINAEAAS